MALSPLRQQLAPSALSGAILRGVVRGVPAVWAFTVVATGCGGAGTPVDGGRIDGSTSDVSTITSQDGGGSDTGNQTGDATPGDAATSDASVVGNFTMTVSPTISVGIGFTGAATVTVNRGTGFSGNVTVNVSGLPAGVSSAAVVV